jgi:predicted AlkP superfamily pyrophosphatase or phosphodiesterase
MQWLQLPDAQRPRFMTLYFEHVDKASHDHGPDSEQAVIARRNVDAMLQSLLQHLTDAGFDRSVNLILVSDHGFEAVPAAQTLDISQLIPRDIAELVSIGQVVGFRPQPGKTAEAEQQLLGEHAHYTCWRKTELPANWHYGTHPRIPPIVCQMEAGWDALWSDKFAQRQQQNTTHGSHGFDPELTAMRASFIAAGPAFAEGVTLPLFDNVNVYPLLMHLLQLDTEPNDGDITPLLPALKNTP